MDTNRIFMSGNVVRDTELTRDNQGAAVYFQIVSTRAYLEDNVWKEKECLIEVEAYDRLATRYAPYLKKGQKISVEGYLKEIELERRLTYAIHATAMLLAEEPSFEPGKAKTTATGTAATTPSRAPEKPRGENDVLRRLAADVGGPPPESAPFVEG